MTTAMSRRGAEDRRATSGNSASCLRNALADRILSLGTFRTAVEAAFRTVPRELSVLSF